MRREVAAYVVGRVDRLLYNSRQSTLKSDEHERVSGKHTATSSANRCVCAFVGLLHIIGMFCQFGPATFGP